MTTTKNLFMRDRTHDDLPRVPKVPAVRLPPILTADGSPVQAEAAEFERLQALATDARRNLVRVRNQREKAEREDHAALVDAAARGKTTPDPAATTTWEATHQDAYRTAKGLAAACTPAWVALHGALAAHQGTLARMVTDQNTEARERVAAAAAAIRADIDEVTTRDSSLTWINRAIHGAAGPNPRLNQLGFKPRRSDTTTDVKGIGRFARGIELGALADALATWAQRPQLVELDHNDNDGDAA